MKITFYIFPYRARLKMIQFNVPLSNDRCTLQEQQQLCAALQETKALLEEQLSDARARSSSIRELEKENLLLRHKIIDVDAVGGATLVSQMVFCSSIAVITSMRVLVLY